MKIETSKGYTEVILVDNCDFDEFYKTAAILKSTLHIEFTDKLNDFDSLYWDFTYKDSEFVLHYNIYLGISIFPKNFTNATSSDNRSVIEVSELLNQRLEEFDNEENFISNFFKDPPIQWGLRGDPHLWNDLKEATRKKKVPASAGELEKLLHKLFEEITGEKPKKGSNVFVGRYDKGGMSSGMVSGDFWLNKGFSLIIQRYIESEMR